MRVVWRMVQLLVSNSANVDCMAQTRAFADNPKLLFHIKHRETWPIISSIAGNQPGRLG